ncbi:MAG: O-antigen ligase family protein [Acidobacteriota bacterium]
MLAKLTTFLFGAAIVWGTFIYGATEIHNTYRLFLLLLIPCLFASWKTTSAWPARAGVILLACLLGAVVYLPTLYSAGFVTVAIGAMAFFIAVQGRVPQDDGGGLRTKPAVFLLLIALGALEGLYAFFQFLLGEFQDGRHMVAGTLVNRNHFAGLMNMTIALAIGALYASFVNRARNARLRAEVYAWSWIIVLSCGLMGLAVLLSLSRAGAITLVSTLLFLGLLLPLKRRQARGASLPGSYAAILLFTVLGLGLWVGLDTLADRFLRLEASGGGRAAVYEATVRMIADHPLAGVGPGMYLWRFRPYQTEELHYWYDYAHNDYLQTAAEWGIPLALLFWAFVLWRMFASARLFLQSRDSWSAGLALGCAGAIFGILLHSAVDFNLQIPGNWAVFCVILALSFGPLRLRPSDSRPRLYSASIRLVVTVVILLSSWRVGQQLMPVQISQVVGGLEGNREAISWDPQRPDFYFQLGLLQRDKPEYQDLEAAVGNLKEAVELNPYRWDYLQELGRGYELAGNDAEAERCYRDSIRLNPRSGLYRWRLANFELRTAGLAAALPDFKKALGLDASYRQAALVLLSGAGATPGQLLAVWPPDGDSALMLLRHFGLEAPHLQAELWSRALREDPPPTLAQASFYINQLRESVAPDVTRGRWLELCKANGLEDRDFEMGGNAVWNGGFELPCSGQGLDWRLPSKGRNFRVSVTDCLELEFFGRENTAFSAVEQVIPIEPSQLWRISFRIRSEGITTDQGPHLEVTDQEGKILYASQGSLGTTPWTTVTGEFRTEAATRAMRLRLRRPTSWKIDNLISGKLWVDNIQIRKAPDVLSRFSPSLWK